VHGGTGYWFVTFPGSVITGKPVIASLSRLNNDIPPGEIEATPCGGGPDALSGCGTNNNNNTALVNIGLSNGTGDDHAFYLMVLG
jgi:hypothetical protein